MAVAAAVMTSQGAAARAVESADAPRTRSLDLSEFCALCGAWLREARLDERTLSERVDGFVAHARSSRERSLLLHSVAITALTCTGDGAIIRLARALDGAVPATACDELSGALSSLPSEAAQVQRCLLVGFCMRLAEPLDDRVLARTCKELLLDWRKDPKFTRRVIPLGAEVPSIPRVQVVAIASATNGSISRRRVQSKVSGSEQGRVLEDQRRGLELIFKHRAHLFCEPRDRVRDAARSLAAGF